ncbi:MAG: glycosyltransferase [Aeromonas sp.]
MVEFKFSLLMSVYGKDSPDYFTQALDSLCGISCAPCEVVLVADGPLTAELSAVIAAYQTRLPLRLVALAQNVGLGAALAHGLSACTQEWVARFDSDDICHPERFIKQVAYLQAHPATDLLGGWIAEFDDSWQLSHAVRQTPLTAAAIARHARTRNPFNHMTVMFKKAAVLAAGNYQQEFLFEDYALWVRLIVQGAQIANLPEVLVYARTGSALATRRGGWRYAKAEWLLQRDFYRRGFISLSKMLANLAVRIPTRMMPRAVRNMLYRTYLRR